MVLCSFISPFLAERRLGARPRRRANSSRFSSIRRARSASRADPKGLYKKALAGEIANFTGITQSYEPPEAPELILGREGENAEAASTAVLAYLASRGVIPHFDEYNDWTI